MSISLRPYNWFDLFQAQLTHGGSLFRAFVISCFRDCILKFSTRKNTNYRTKELRLKATTCILVLGLVFSTQTSAGESPDELYNRGRFAEAEKAYADLDMDHPKELPYRYNRGCAAYQNSDYRGAWAAFSSVLRRAESDETRFKSAYNLGNAAYKQGDFATAVAYYKKAILYSPESEDAKYNLEMALRELEKQKNEKAPDQDKGAQKDPAGPQDKEDHSKSGKGEEGSEKSSQDREQQGNEKGQAESGRAEEPESGKGSGSDQGRREEGASPDDLSGALSPVQALPGQEDDEGTSGPASATIDKKRAEALLDNVKEDRFRFLRFQVPDEKRHGVPSGKDW